MNVEKLEKFVKKQMMKNIANYEAEFNNIVDNFELYKIDDNDLEEEDEDFNKNQKYYNYTGSIGYEFGNRKKNFLNYYDPFGSDTKMDKWKDTLEDVINEYVGDQYNAFIDYDSSAGYQGIVVSINRV